MGYINALLIDNGTVHLIEPLLYATAEGTSSAITVTMSNFELVTGVYVNVKVGSVSANATLNVNSTGAKDIYYKGIKINSTTLTEGSIYTFIYTGTYWEVLGDITSKNIMVSTSAEWLTRYNLVMPRGTIMIYTDHGTVTETLNGVEVAKNVPGIKIADGSTPVIDLAFVGDDVVEAIESELDDHINDNVRHITAAERTFWNNKINCNDTVNNNNLILNRN